MVVARELASKSSVSGLQFTLLLLSQSFLLPPRQNRRRSNRFFLLIPCTIKNGILGNEVGCYREQSGFLTTHLWLAVSFSARALSRYLESYRYRRAVHFPIKNCEWWLSQPLRSVSTYATRMCCRHSGCTHDKSSNSGRIQDKWNPY
jgi:hypothetical protein